MTEQYLGDTADRKYIEVFLQNVRQQGAQEIVIGEENPIVLSDTERMSTYIDTVLFQEIVGKAHVALQKQFDIRIEPITPQRYYLALAPDSALGGFHHEWSLGYQYWYRAGYVVLCSGSYVPNKKLRTLELARSYLHDCLHQSTFVSFRRAHRGPASCKQEAKHRVPEIYREQYGVNFRNKDGVPYSSRELTAQSPSAINLNLLMDGAIVLVVGAYLRDYHQHIFEGLHGIEEQVRNEIFLEPFYHEHMKPAVEFWQGVTKPTERFVRFWGGEMFQKILLQAMCSGELDTIKQHIAHKDGRVNAWEKIFKRPEFEL